MEPFKEMAIADKLSPTAISNLFTMGISARNDPRQRVPDMYAVPGLMVRELRARLILEEALETIAALGFSIRPKSTKQFYHVSDVDLLPIEEMAVDIDDVIDGCADTIYVAIGTMLVHGAPDLPHLAEINRTNNAKFPGAVAITNPETGKFQKPPGWQPPDHKRVRQAVGHVALNEFANNIITAATQ